MQHFHFALHAVRHVEFDRAVGRIGRYLFVFGQRAQFADGHLHLLQQGLAHLLAEQVDAQAVVAPFGMRVLVEFIEHADEIAPLPPPARQERVAVRMQRFQRDLRQVGAVALALALVLRAQQVAPVDDVAPVELARVGHGQHHLRMARQRGQRLQGLVWQGRDAKQHHPARQLAGRRVAGGDGSQEGVVDVGAARIALESFDVGGHGAPQLRLPALVFLQHDGLATGRAQLVAPGRPVGQPVGTVDLVLVEQVGQAFGQLQPAFAIAIGEEIAQRRKHGVGQQRRQKTHQPPGQRRFIEGRHARHAFAAQHAPVAFPQQSRRQGDARGGAHAHFFGQGDLQPLGHAIRLHQEDVGLQRRQRVAAQPLEDGRAQLFQLVAVQDEEAGRDGRLHAVPMGCRACGRVAAGVKRVLSPLPASGGIAGGKFQ
ncbi:hypothetical protein D3C81_843530 [compost metagenome]